MQLAFPSPVIFRCRFSQAPFSLVVGRTWSSLVFLSFTLNSCVLLLIFGFYPLVYSHLVIFGTNPHENQEACLQDNHWQVRKELGMQGSKLRLRHGGANAALPSNPCKIVCQTSLKEPLLGKQVYTRKQVSLFKPSPVCSSFPVSMDAY